MNISKSLKNYSLVAFILSLSCLTAQTDKISFKEYGIMEGLPEELALRFIQDNQGYIWIGTQNGLAKFDGYTMKVFRTDLEDETGLRLRNLLGGLLQSKDGVIWIGGISHNGGLANYNPKLDKFTNYLIDENDADKVPFPNSYILFEDFDHNIWFSSFGDNQKAYLCKINPSTNKVSRYPYRVSVKANDLVLNYMMAQSKIDSSIWLRSREYDLLKYNKQKDSFIPIVKKGTIIPGTSYRDSIIDLNYAPINKVLTMTNNNRLFLFDPVLETVVKTYEFKNRDSIPWGATIEDPYGDIWVTAHDNISIINPKTDEMQHFKFGEGELDFGIDLINLNDIQPEAFNKEKLVFEISVINDFNRRDRHTLIYEFKSKKFTYYDYRFNDKNNTFEDNTANRSYYLDNSGLLWIGTRPNLYKQAPKSSQIKQYNYNSQIKNGLPSDSITVFYEDKQNRLWFGTPNDLVLKKDEETYEAYNWSSKGVNGSRDGFVLNMLEDDYGYLWLATNEGLFRFSLNDKTFESIYRVDVRQKFVSSMLLRSADELWISVMGQGVYVFDTKSAKLIKSFDATNQETHGLKSREIFNLYKDSENFLWLGDIGNNEYGAYKYDPKNETFKSYVRNPQDSTSLISNEIVFFIEDDWNRLWIGTDGGICRYDRENDQFLQNTDGVNIPSVRDAVKSTNGRIWVTTYSGGGLTQIGPGINDIEVYGEGSGLLHNDINNIIHDDLGKLWLPNMRGMSVFDTLTKSYTHYFEKDGYKNYNRFSPMIKTKDGHILIGGEDGLNVIDTYRLIEADSTVPKIHITDMVIMDSTYTRPDGELFKQSVSFTGQLTLEHWQKDLSFNFVGIHYLRPEDNMYSWKLENYDDHWSAPTKARQATYTNLSPGTYTFRVKASNADGVWNEEGASMTIIIAPPWWLSWWAYALYVLIALLIGIWIHKTQKERTLRNERERAQQKELEQAKEIEIAYENLKATQAKLIQSEKMASLGELTAGIAHEIQNPLNFVNNFSEVSAELLEELKEELEEGDLEEVKLLIKDINENLEKINHHGKRADGIVKGMLQHSRDNSGKKETIDINQLADEYLRLAYHGFRAKDKSFNSQLETDFQKSLKRIKVVPQDIGRVILNLITNAFHAVTEKKILLNGSEESDYSPTVWVKTFESDQHVVIEVKDNGNGIPEQVKHKIFQPFFTTKPAGQGTGLGLSLSYDIVKAHNGDIEISSEEGMGTTFSVSLPKQNLN